MKNILAINGSPRKSGNTTQLLKHFLSGARNYTRFIEEIVAQEADIKYCQGCLRCNVLGKCSLKNDEWEEMSDKIMRSDVLVFASPIYFHHVTAQLKTIIDRFRSFIHIHLTESGLEHSPRHKWEKDFVLLLSMGSSNDVDAVPVIELFEFMTSILGAGNTLHVIKGTRLAVSNQVIKSKDELVRLYPKLGLTSELATHDFKQNQDLLNKCYQLGEQLAR